ncbi:MAG TPA: recombinase family protein [Anaeromyxobacteraceae bacterium]|nr:recombinase family protein [Anaeromyxobacteraceae bacterium]
MSEKIRDEHRQRSAAIYIRQSTMGQVLKHKESQKLQYALAERARELGFHQVEVIDEDLAISGSGLFERPGFQRLVANVCTGMIGAIFSIEVSRLARNGREWHHLIDLCGLFGTLVIDTDGVYDPRLSQDRLVLGMKGSMSEFELSIFRQRSSQAIRAKAQRGELQFIIPIGFCWTQAGKVELDPDRRVQEAIRLVFRKFEALGSVRQALLWFRHNKVELPGRRYGDLQRTVVWRLPVYNALYTMVNNPFYAGAYVFGKTEVRTHVVDGKARKTCGHMKDPEQWTVLIRDHHPGYVSWATYERNQVTLAENAHMKKRMTRKAGRGGRALLAGLLRCRRCGRMLQVDYGGGGPNREARSHRYLCRGEAINLGEGTCISFGGLRPDQAVSSNLLDVVQPTAVEAALEATAQVSQKDIDEVRAVSLELEQARYEAALASRRYEAVDPENRLVAGELEARWNGALARVRGLESRLEETRQRPTPKATVDRKSLLSLAMNLPAVWNSEKADMKLKQRIARTVIREIVADVDEQASEIVLVIHWVGGRHTEVRTPKVKTGEHRRVTGADAVAVVRRMAGRWPDERIAATLNRLGLRTGTGMTWIESRVATVRQRFGLPAHPAVNGPSTLTLEQACQRLGVSNTPLRNLIKSKQLPAVQAAPGAPWEIPADALETKSFRQAIERIRAGRSRWKQNAADRWTLKLPNTDRAEK